MQLFPAIDLRGGKVVRLTQGDYDRMTVYGEDPCAQAREFLARTEPFPITTPSPRWQSRAACISK